MYAAEGELAGHQLVYGGKEVSIPRRPQIEIPWVLFFITTLIGAPDMPLGFAWVTWMPELHGGGILARSLQGSWPGESAVCLELVCVCAKGSTSHLARAVLLLFLMSSKYWNPEIPNTFFGLLFTWFREPKTLDVVASAQALRMACTAPGDTIRH